MIVGSGTLWLRSQGQEILTSRYRTWWRRTTRPRRTHLAEAGGGPPDGVRRIEMAVDNPPTLPGDVGATPYVGRMTTSQLPPTAADVSQRVIEALAGSG